MATWSGRDGQLEPFFPTAFNDILERAAHHKILLQKSQSSARFGRIVGIKHACERFGGDVLDDGAGEIAVGELGEIE